MKKVIKPAIFIAIGLFIAFPLFSLTYYTMVRTTTPQFCATCHEIQFAYNTWKTSTHVNNAHGFVADCMDCHLPAPHDTFDFFYAKTFHGIKDIMIHFTQDEYDHALRRIFKESPRSNRRVDRVSASSMLANQRTRLLRRTSKPLGVPAYVVDQVLRQLIHRARVMKLKQSQSESEAMARVSRLLTRATISYIRNSPRLPL